MKKFIRVLILIGQFLMAILDFIVLGFRQAAKKRKFYPILLLLIFSCAPKKEIVRDHFVSDTLITHKTEVVTLPVHNRIVIKEPCKDSLNIDQTIETPTTTLSIRSEGQNLIVEQQTDSTKSTNTKETSKRQEILTVTKTTTKYRTPKWCWTLLIVVIAYISYRFLRIKIPFLKVLPY